MSETKNSARRNPLTARRLVLLGSAAGLAVALIAVGPGGYVPSHLPSWSSSALAADTAALPHPASFADLVTRVKPAVISVRVKIDESAKQVSMDEGDQNQNIPFAPGSPMEKFFQQFGMPDMPHAQPHRHGTMMGEGSGFFISADGYAVTNNHVVDHASSVQVTTDDGTVYTAKVVGTDPKTDLALIKVDGKNDLPFVKFADHAPRVGDWVVAVGNPFGLGGTVTAGIVSARGRDIGAGPYDDYIQIDAPINKGNSGGPAFNVDGEVIGINSAIYSPSGGSVGIGFDIPADTAKLVIAQLEAHGHVTRGYLGRPGPAGHRGDRRQPRHEEGRGRDGRPAAGRQPGGQGRHPGRRRHHHAQWHPDQGRPRARPQRWRCWRPTAPSSWRSCGTAKCGPSR